MAVNFIAPFSMLTGIILQTYAIQVLTREHAKEQNAVEYKSSNPPAFQIWPYLGYTLIYIVTLVLMHYRNDEVTRGIFITSLIAICILILWHAYLSLKHLKKLSYLSRKIVFLFFVARVLICTGILSIGLKHLGLVERANNF